MADQAELDDPGDDSLPARPGGGLAKQGQERALPPLRKWQRRPEVEKELTDWYRLDGAHRLLALRAAAGGPRTFTAEALVHLSSLFLAPEDRKALNLAFEAFSRAVTPLLLYQAFGQVADERHEQAQEILLQTFEDIKNGNAGYAESNFADYAKKKAISLYRKRGSRFEGSGERIEPTDELDPVEHLPEPLAGPEARALLTHAVQKLPPKIRAVFIQFHVMGLTKEEIAQQHGVDESNVRYWLKKANATLGLSGGKDDR
jgi:RNA polymerase sigma factor (sigma-70 family)